MDRTTPENQAETLTDAEIERLESRLFCAGGPPPALTRKAATQIAGAAALRAACKR